MSNGKIKNIVKVMVFGTFDGLHRGHLNFFKQAKSLSTETFLTVSIARDRNVKKIKKVAPKLRELERYALVLQCDLVDKVVLSGINNYLPHILKENPDIIALGYDQRAYVGELKRDLNKKGKKIQIVRLKPHKKHVYKNHLIKKRQGI